MTEPEAAVLMLVQEDLSEQNREHKRHRQRQKPPGLQNSVMSVHAQRSPKKLSAAITMTTAPTSQMMLFIMFSHSRELGSAIPVKTSAMHVRSICCIRGGSGGAASFRPLGDGDVSSLRFQRRFCNIGSSDRLQPLGMFHGDFRENRSRFAGRPPLRFRGSHQDLECRLQRNFAVDWPIWATLWQDGWFYGLRHPMEASD